MRSFHALSERMVQGNISSHTFYIMKKQKNLYKFILYHNIAPEHSKAHNIYHL